MTEQFNVEDLAGVLPAPAQLPDLLESAPRGVLHSPKSEAYVPPPLIGDLGQVAASGVVLIDASAAVGKSALARELARRTGNPMWSLEQFQIGSNFVDGTLSRAYGFQGAAKFESSGAAVIVDALDEGIAGAGLANFEAAMENLAHRVLLMESNGPRFVVLGRIESIDYAEMLLAESGVDTSRVSIGFFEEISSKAFLDAMLDEKGESAHRSHRQPFELARDQLFGIVFDVLGVSAEKAWEDDVARGFLGYAPVLTAIAQFFGGDGGAVNFGLVSQQLAEADRSSIWGLLTSIVEGVLLREQEKMEANLADLWEAAPAKGWYSIEVQCALLVQVPVVSTRGLTVPDGIPADRAAAFAERAQVPLSEHPFLVPGIALTPVRELSTRFSSVVFRDYVFARALLDGGTSVSTVRQTCASDAYRPSPLLSRFVFDLLEAWDTGRAKSAIDIGTVPMLVQSLGTRRQAHEQTFVHIHVQDEGDEDSVLIDATIEGRPASVEVVGTSAAPLEILRSLSNASIDLPEATVRIGTGLGVVSLGPEVDIACARVVIDAEDVTVYGTRDPADPDRWGGVVISAADLEDLRVPTVTTYPVGALGLDVRQLEYPWLQHQIAAASTGEETGLLEACRDLWSVVKWFRGRAAVELAYPSDPIDAALAKGKTSQRMFDYCVERNVITEDGGRYRLHIPTLGAPLDAVRRLDLTEGLRSFLKSYI